MAIPVVAAVAWWLEPWLFPFYSPPVTTWKVSHTLVADSQLLIPLASCPEGPEDSLSQWVASWSEQEKTSLNHLRHLTGETDYYLSVHDVQDEGFSMVAAYSASLAREIRGKESLLLKLDTALKAKSLHIDTLTLRGPLTSPPEGRPDVFMATLGGLWRHGHWLRAPRQGKGAAIDHDGNLWAGTWRADTLASGIRLDSLGVYYGEADRWLMPSGHGSYQAFRDGPYYEGQWLDGLRHGFGFMADSTGLKAGEWRADAFRGERMSYTTERIYGIDISKYQHMRGGRRGSAIHWDRLRLTNLGHLNNPHVKGEADWPISFVYIKATEGQNILNPYYAADSRQARRHGLRQGAYHFFSTRSTGEAQANYFLRHASFKRGDLPPVLDVEPSDAQIRAMGGPEEMFKHIEQWLDIVEKKVGVRPILYLNQRFVNVYLETQPHLKETYDVWMARYSEYKPGVRLVIWQLSADGRVSGITGDVDINVFNGYKTQWDLFIENKCIK